MQVARGFDVLHEMAAAPPRGPAGDSGTVDSLRLQALQLARRERLVHAAFCWRMVPLDAPPAPPAPTLCAGGERLHAPALLPASGTLTALACCACTLGPGLPLRVLELHREHRGGLAAALDALGREMLAAIVRRAHDRIHADTERQGLGVSGELRLDGLGPAAPEQAAVLRLAAADRIGMQNSPAALPPPRSSALFVLGVGTDLPPADWSRCEDCPRCRTCRVVARNRARRLRT